MDRKLSSTYSLAHRERYLNAFCMLPLTLLCKCKLCVQCCFSEKVEYFVPVKLRTNTTMPRRNAQAKNKCIASYFITINSSYLERKLEDC